ncbi:GAP family protein [Aureibacillus halotolerans]|uniref:Sap-like sulfolipid-1-addressing protein n=1 Tax=Aureibacillus halotolerans TaxID=1508390 RepID=A0A4R6U754_9BACI|nr:GAP family protein [Aureibacillus halotolerans]TDQ40385.1 Sap-like sulfolipid-1-addressing protein [Aureibacillus halotolerans]
MWVTVAGLALLDSLSFASIVMTLVMLLSSSYSPLRMMTYLLTVSFFYFILGTLLNLGFDSLLQSQFSEWRSSSIMPYIQVTSGIALILLSIWLDKKPRKSSSKISRFKPKNTFASMVKLGFLVALIESMTMLPFLSFVGIVTASELTFFEWGPQLAAYVLIMIAPPTILVALKTLIGTKVDSLLVQINRKIAPFVNGAVSTVACIAGLYLIADVIAK